MILWVLFAVMTAIAIAAVLWPLSRPIVARGGSDVVVYRDQLDEIERDKAAGLIGAAEADAAKVEVSRRLLAAADAAKTEAPAPAQTSILRQRVAALAGLAVLPIGAVALYLALGSPDMPGMPLAARQSAQVDSDRTIEALIAKVEAHVNANPNDGRAWEVLAPVYMRIGRYDNAVVAWANAIRLNGPSASREADYGEALVAAANGVVTADAKAAFQRAMVFDKTDVMARFYMAMAADQDGRRAEAEAVWREIIAQAPPGAAYVEMVRHTLERKAPGAPNMEASASAPDGQHDVNAMVERLANRLKQSGGDADAWAQLVRSYRSLGQNDKAQAALADAQKALAGNPDQLRTFTQIVEGNPPAAPAASAALPPLTPLVQPQSPAPAASGPNAEQMAAAANMGDKDRNDMVRGMVSRLADRLKQNGDDVEGWQRLLRAYVVLGDRDKAQAAAADARKALAADSDKLRQLNDVIKDLKIEG